MPAPMNTPFMHIRLFQMRMKLRVHPECFFFWGGGEVVSLGKRLQHDLRAE